MKKVAEIAELKMSGKSLQEIAVLYGLSRERIRQILKATGLVFPRATRKNVRVEMVCLECSKTFYIAPSIKYGRKFCSKKCSVVYKKIHRITPPKEAIEEWKKWHNAKMKEWYRKHKDSPSHKALTMLRNAGVTGYSIHDFE